MAINQIANLGVKVDPRGAITGASRAKRAITGIGNSARGVKNRIMSMQGALLGLGAGALVKSIITTASEVESLQVRLKFLTGSAEDSAKAFETMTKFASQVPFSLQDIERASPLLLTVADDVDQLNELLSITGDIAAVSGLSFEATAGQLQRALSGGIASADLFRERGVKAFLDFEEGVQYSAEETSKHIFKLFRDGTTTAKGATEELKDTYQGQVSMMSDAFRELKLVIADAGVFELTAEAVKKLTSIFKDPETMKTMETFGQGIVNVGKALGGIIENTLKLPKWMLEVGIIMAILGGKKGKLVAVGLVAMAQALDKITDAYKSLTSVPNAFVELNEDLAKAEGKFENVRDQLFATQEEIDKYYAKFRRNEDFTGDEYKDFKRLQKLIDQLTPRFDKHKASVQELRDQIDDLNASFEASVQSSLGQTVLSSIRPIKIKLDDNDVKEKVKGINNEFAFLSHNVKSVGENFTSNLTPATEIMGQKFDELARKTLDANEKIKEFSDGLADNIEDSIMRMTQGLMSFKDVVKNVFQYVASQIIRNNIAKPLANSLSSLISGAVGGFATGTSSPSNIISSLFPPRANGGNVNAGQPYMVGEKGAELFVPKSAGDIVPNNQMGGGTVVNVTYSPQVNALDPRTASAVLVENAPLIVGVIRQAFERNGQQVAI